MARSMLARRTTSHFRQLNCSPGAPCRAQSRGGSCFRGTSAAANQKENGLNTGETFDQGLNGPPRVDLPRLLAQAVDRGASDVHLKVGRPPIIRFDGELEPLHGFSAL